MDISRSEQSAPTIEGVWHQSCGIIVRNEQSVVVLHAFLSFLQEARELVCVIVAEFLVGNGFRSVAGDDIVRLPAIPSRFCKVSLYSSLIVGGKVLLPPRDVVDLVIGDWCCDFLHHPRVEVVSFQFINLTTHQV